MALVLAVIGGLAWVVLHPNEPRYRGRSLTFWLNQYVTNTLVPDDSPPGNARQDEAKNALRELGTNAIPTLVQMAGRVDSPLKRDLDALLRRLLPIHRYADRDYHAMAAYGFYALGPMGKAAVPALVELLKETNEDLRMVAADSLGNIGPASQAAVPLLIGFIQGTNRSLRFGAIINLGRIHAEPELAVPALIQTLKASNTMLAITIGALREFGASAKPAVPALLPFLNDKSAWVRSEATNTLKAIDPEAAGKAGIR